MSSYVHFFTKKKVPVPLISSSIDNKDASTTGTTSTESQYVAFEELSHLSHQPHIHSAAFDSIGTIISLIIFQSNEYNRDKYESYAYICKLSYPSPNRKQSSLYSRSKHHANQRLLMSNNDVNIIKYDGSVKIPLSGMETNNSDEKYDQEMSSNTKVNLAMEILSKKIGGVLQFKLLKYIIDLDPDIQVLNDQTGKQKKISNDKYCWVIDWDSNKNNNYLPKHDVLGFLVSLKTPAINRNHIQDHKIMNLVPTPLLSLSMSRISEKKSYYNHKYSSSHDDDDQKNFLLMQCLKRKLVGKLIIYDSIIELRAPSTRGKIDIYYFQVNELLPFQESITGVSTYSEQSNQSLLFLIMPSTRITLDAFIHNAKESKSNDKMSSIQRSCQDDNRPHHEGVLVNTINAMRLCSKKRHNKKSNRNERDKNSSFDICRVFLLSGTPGVGKTYSVRKTVEASKNLGLTKMISIRGSELLSVGNESDAAHELTKIFTSASSFASKKYDCISLIFMDECDALFSSMIISATLAALLDQMTSNLGETFEPGWDRILVVAATNRIDAVPTILRRPGRFDRELCISPPDTNQRFNILKNLLNHYDVSRIEVKGATRSNTMRKVFHSSMCTDDDLIAVSDLCVGYVASDLAALVKAVLLLGMNHKNNKITIETFRIAMKDVGASALRDSTISAPPATRWDDIAGDAGGAKIALRQAIEWPKTKRKHFASLGLKPPRGILLHGPPGCSKTTLVRAAAGSMGVAFLSLSPADVYASSFVGEAEAVVRRAFSLARSAAPCILFFDEIDTLVGTSNNESGMDRGTNAEARVLSTFLNEMDGVDGSINDGVLVLGATNRPSTLDAAILRPGRFDRVIYVPPPDQEGRKQIFESQCKADSIDIEYLSRNEVSGSMTGAEIVGACREAAMLAVRESMANEQKDGSVPTVLQRHIEAALQMCTPLLSNLNILDEYTKFEESQNKKIVL